MTESRTAKAMILASGGFLTVLVSMLSAGVLARLFEKRDYGTYQQTILVFTSVSPLLMMGLPQALYYFLPRQERPPRQVLSESLLLLVTIGGAFSTLLVLGGHRIIASLFSNPALSSALLVFAVYPMFAIPISALGPCLITYNRLKQMAVFNVTSRSLVLVSIIGAAIWFSTVNAALAGMLLGTAMSFFVALYLMFAACRGTVWKPERLGIREQLKFGVPLGLEAMFGILSIKIGHLIVSSMCSIEDFADYTNGAIEVPLIGIVTGSVVAVIIPDLTRYLKRGEHEGALQLWQNAIVKCSAFLLPLMVLLLMLAPDVITTVFSSRYVESALPFRILLLLLPIRCASFGTLYIAGNRSKLILVKTVLSLVVTAALTVPFIGIFGPWGAAVATVVSVYGFIIPLNLIFLAGIVKVKWSKILPSRRVMRVLLASVIAGFPPYVLLLLLNGYLPIVRLVVSGFVFTASVLVVFHLMGIRELMDVLRAIPQLRSQAS